MKQWSFAGDICTIGNRERTDKELDPLKGFIVRANCLTDNGQTGISFSFNGLLILCRHELFLRKGNASEFHQEKMSAEKCFTVHKCILEKYEHLTLLQMTALFFIGF